MVLPVPDGPTNSHADSNGLAASAAQMRLGLSRPTKAEMECGRYRSVRGVGKARLDWVGWVKPNRSDIVVTFQWSGLSPWDVISALYLPSPLAHGSLGMIHTGFVL